MTRRPTLLLAASLALALLGPAALPAAGQDAPAPPQATPLAVPPDAPAGDGTGVRLVTEAGDILIGLFNESAPVASENFLNLATSGFYDGVGFHRLVPGFVIQGGDPDGTGFGGPGYTIPDEPTVGRYGRGIVAMARTPEPNSAGSQFFIVLDDAAEGALSAYNTYAIFGRVIEGMDVVDAIAAGPVDGDTALEPVHIISAQEEAVTLPDEPTRAPIPEPGAPDLEAVIPDELGGVRVERQSYNGAEIEAGYAPEDPALAELQGLLATIGAEVGDLSVANGYVASGEEDYVSLTVIRIDGVAAQGVIDTFIPYILGTGELTTSTEEIGGRSVLVLSDGQEAGLTVRVVVAGDTVILIDGTEALRAEAIGALATE